MTVARGHEVGGGHHYHGGEVDVHVGGNGVQVDPVEAPGAFARERDVSRAGLTDTLGRMRKRCTSRVFDEDALDEGDVAC